MSGMGHGIQLEDLYQNTIIKAMTEKEGNWDFIQEMIHSILETKEVEEYHNTVDTRDKPSRALNNIVFDHAPF